MNTNYVIIDGSNAVRTLFGYNRGMKARDLVAEDNRHSKTFLSLLAALHRRLKIPEIKVYFDGTVRPHEVTPRDLPPGIRLEFGAGKSADELMFNEARSIVNTTGGIIMVTDDQGLTRQVKSLDKLKVKPVGIILTLAAMAHLNLRLYFQ